MRKLIRYVLLIVAILLGIFLTAYGLFSIYGMDFHDNSVVSIAYCGLPLLALPAIVFVLRWRWLVALPALFAVIYLAVYSALNWRTCASDGYCGSSVSTVLMTLGTHSALAYFGVAILAIVAACLERRPQVDARAGK